MNTSSRSKGRKSGAEKDPGKKDKNRSDRESGKVDKARRQQPRSYQQEYVGGYGNGGSTSYSHLNDYDYSRSEFAGSNQLPADPLQGDEGLEDKWPEDTTGGYNHQSSYNDGYQNPPVGVSYEGQIDGYDRELRVSHEVQVGGRSLGVASLSAAKQHQSKGKHRGTKQTRPATTLEEGSHERAPVYHHSIEFGTSSRPRSDQHYEQDYHGYYAADPRQLEAPGFDTDLQNDEMAGQGAHAVPGYLDEDIPAFDYQGESGESSPPVKYGQEEGIDDEWEETAAPRRKSSQGPSDVKLLLQTRKGAKWQDALGLMDSGNSLGPTIQLETVFKLGFRHGDIDFSCMKEFDVMGGVPQKTAGLIRITYSYGGRSSGVQEDFHIMEKLVRDYDVVLPTDPPPNYTDEKPFVAVMKPKRDLSEKEKRAQREKVIKAEEAARKDDLERAKRKEAEKRRKEASRRG